jgi:hypothetical protein
MEKILELSLASAWNRAREEWDLKGVYLQPYPPGTCLCGHCPIHRHCILVNRHNGREVTVGSCCVKRFLGIDGDPLFRALERLIKNPLGASLTEDLIRFAFDQGILNERETDFYLDTNRWRRLSPKQEYWRQVINIKVLRAMVRELTDAAD